jgi:hypothetical protein
MQSIGIWGLREEARKSWDYFVCNEIVYRAEVGAGNLKRPQVFTEKYLHGDMWLDLHFTYPCGKQGDGHLEAICEVANEVLPSPQRKMDIERTGVDGNGAMLVECPQFIQLPKGVLPKSVSSVVWLKAINGACHCGWKQLESIPVGGIIDLENKKTYLSLFPLRENSRAVKMGETPRELIQRGPKIANEVAEQHGDGFRSIPHPHTPDFYCPIKICFVDNGIGWKVKPSVNFNLKSVEVFLRPTGLHFYEG